MFSKNTFLNICLITLTFFIAIIVVYLLSMALFILKYNKSDYYILDKDKIPSIYKINGKRNLYYYKSSKKNNNIIKTFKYKNVEDVKSDLTNYIDELKNNYDFVYTSDVDLNDLNNEIELSTNSTENNKIIILNISYNENGYTIKIIKGMGNLNFYK